VKIAIPNFCLVVLLGMPRQPLDFVRRHFKLEEVIPPESYRGLANPDAASNAFAEALSVVEARLERRELVMIDATNVPSRDRARLMSIAMRYHALPVAIVLNPTGNSNRRREMARAGGEMGANVIRKHALSPSPNAAKLGKEGFRSIHQLSSGEDVDAIEIVREPLPADLRGEEGPFDIIGDVHGCAGELEVLLAKLDYSIEAAGIEGERNYRVSSKSGRRAIFAGDFVDRGPRIPDVLRLVMAMAEAGEALCVLGNHDDKFLRWLKGRDVTVNHGLERSAEQMANTSPAFKSRVATFLHNLESHVWLDGGKLVVTHAGIKESMIGRSSRAVREFCLYGDTSGEKDEYGFPVRGNWAADYGGGITVVYGHTPVRRAEWLNNTICIDTGCVFGGTLTALQWPGKALLSVPAQQVYWRPQGPFAAANRS
jgi:protein phosphatase